MENEIEIWKDIEGYEGFYVISNLSRIKSIYREVVRSNGRIYTCQESFLKRYKRKNTGYWVTTLNKNGVAKLFLLSRLVAKNFIPNPENKPTINHKWGDKDDNRACALEWATHSENIQHAYDTGLKINLRGEEHMQSKLTKTDVIKIRELLKTSKTQTEIGALFGVTYATISDIKRGRNWAWLI